MCLYTLLAKRTWVNSSLLRRKYKQVDIVEDCEPLSSIIDGGEQLDYSSKASLEEKVVGEKLNINEEVEAPFVVVLTIKRSLPTHLGLVTSEAKEGTQLHSAIEESCEVDQIKSFKSMVQVYNGF